MPNAHFVSNYKSLEINIKKVNHKEFSLRIHTKYQQPRTLNEKLTTFYPKPKTQALIRYRNNIPAGINPIF
jgi:hypothetical protein